MGTNSIRANLNKDSIVSEIKLSKSSDFKKQKSFIVVEGEDDYSMFKKFCSENVTIYESYSGKCGVEEIVNCEHIKDYRLIGIRDLDYCKKTDNERIFYYDNSCMEMMIISFNKIFKSLYSEFYRGKLESNDLLLLIFNELNKLSLLRKMNEEKILEVNFQCLKFNKLVQSDGKLNYDKIAETLQQSSPNCNFNIKKFFDRRINSETTSLDEYLKITNGHDFIHLFKIICEKSIAKTGINIKEITSAMRVAFDERYFYNTKLYISMISYCKKNQIEVLE